MDPVSLTLGLAPLCLSALSGSRYIRKKIKLLRGHDKELHRIRKRLQVFISNFQDESQLLLQEVVSDRSLVTKMLDDLSHPHWVSSELETSLKEYLGKKLDETKAISKQIGDSIMKLDEILDTLEDNHSNRSQASVAVQSARNALGLALKKTELDTAIGDLKESIDEFGRLRKTVRALYKPRVAQRRQQKGVPAILNKYSLVARYSSSFHTAFVRSWSCRKSNDIHSTHAAKLFLDTDTPDQTASFRLILDYETVTESLRRHSLLLLRVRSEDLPSNMTPLARGVAFTSTSLEIQRPPKKARRVRFAESPHGSSTVTSQSQIGPAKGMQLFPEHDLCRASDVCQHVFEKGMTLWHARQEVCIGYLDSDDTVRHRLMTAPGEESTTIQTRPYRARSLDSVIQPSTEVEMSVVEQLQLALRLVQAVLKFHSTPWWRQNWDLSDLSYLDIDTELSTCLSTLHINNTLLPRNDGMAMKQVCAELPPDPSDADSQVLCGIRNVTLHSLGVALLEIGRWELVEGSDILKVRKAAAGKSRLGPKYDALTEKCLYCDFGLGANLRQPELQAAIYEQVVCELEGMVGLLGGRASNPLPTS